MVVDIAPDFVVAALGGVGLGAGLWLLVRGFGGYRSLVRVADTSTSTISSIAAGEVRVSGTVEPAELTLVSLLQSVPCVYYRATVGTAGDDGLPDPGFTEERSLGFRVRDATGSLRVFPRGARFDAPLRFEGETGSFGDEPSGLDVRLGGATRATETDRAIAAAELLRVREPSSASSVATLFDRRGRRSYRESRLEPGDLVTIVGRALPFSDLPDPTGADLGITSDVRADDPEVAADIAEARASGALVGDPATAWGNAAIPGFGIGRPVAEPLIDPAADALPLAGADEAARARRTFEIEPETLVVAASEEVPLLIAHGVPGEVVARGQTRFIVGLLGAILAIASAMVLAMSLGGGFDA
jgi:hypothetical protein